MMTQERQKYDREFKQKAVELSFARGNAREIAEELGIRPELLYRWSGSTAIPLQIKSKLSFRYLSGSKAGIIVAGDTRH